MKHRDIYIDIARGLAIASVVLGHIHDGLDSKLIYVFHMPFFFILSGYLHRVETQEWQYFKKKCIALLIPYFTYLAIIQAPNTLGVLHRFISQPTGENLLIVRGYIAKLLYGGEGLEGAIGVFWFVTCLFLTQQLFNFIKKRVSSTRALLAIAAIFYSVAVIDQFDPTHFAAPWAANVVACTFPFYAMGSVYGKYLFEPQGANSQNRLFIFLATTVTALSALLVALGFDLSFGMKHSQYGYVILSPLAAVCMTKLLMTGIHGLFKTGWLAKYQRTQGAIAFAGTASITIMFVHRLLEYNLPDIIYKQPLLSTLLIVAMCCVLHSLLLRSRLTRVFFLGSKKDFQQLSLTKPIRQS